MLDPVPWFIGEPGAQHSAEVARLLAYAATGGAEGVVASGDARVRPLVVPGGGVRVDPGAVVVRSPLQSQQAYIQRVASETVVDIAAAGSSGARTDLIAVVIRDSSQPGGGDPPDDVAHGPYATLEVVSGVPSGTTRLQDVSGWQNSTGYALARVTLPANTGTVQSSHITDLRQLVSARKDRRMLLEYTTQPLTTINQSAFQDFPRAFNVDVPAWAQKAVVKLDFTTSHWGGECHGKWAMRFDGDQLVLGTWYAGDADGTVRHFGQTIGNEVTIPAGMRGSTVEVVFRYNREGGTGYITNVPSSPVYLDIEFSEAP